MSVAPPASSATDLAPRQLETPFGVFTVNVRDVVHFADGLPGFEQNRKFVLLSSPELAPLHVLHHVDGPAASFLAVDPRIVLADYRTVLSATDRIRLGGGDDRALLWLALVTMDAGQGPSVNLRAPIVINPTCMLGFQVMPHNSLYPLRHPLAVGG
jgi:flagellar assembly factor FliW